MFSWLVSLTILSICLILHRFYLWYRLRHIPGPLSASFSKYWVLRHSWRGKLHMKTAEACFKYGSLCRIGPNEVVTNDPEVLRSMLSTKSLYSRSDWYLSFRMEPDHDNVVSERDNEKHGILRNKMASGYSGRENYQLEQAIDENIQNLKKLIESKYLSTASEYRPMDFARKAQYFTLDVISDIAFGQRFGFLDADDDLFAYIHTTEQTMPIMIFATAMPWLAKVIHSPLLKSLLPSDKDAHGLGKVMKFATDIVRDRYMPDAPDQKDMLGSFIRHGLTQKEARSETLMQVLAGSDTTASAIRATMLHIATNPQVLHRLQAEIDSASISNPIKDSEARKMPYLQAVIKEGLRIFPPVTGLMSKNVPPGGVNIKGYAVPDGTEIGYSVFGLSLDPKLWGSDARVFRPERWLEGSAEEIRQRESNVELLFGYGRWQCLGKSVAQIELNKVFVELLRTYDFTIINPTEPWKCFNAGLFITSDMWMRVTRRESE